MNTRTQASGLSSVYLRRRAGETTRLVREGGTILSEQVIQPTYSTRYDNQSIMDGLKSDIDQYMRNKSTPQEKYQKLSALFS